MLKRNYIILSVVLTSLFVVFLVLILTGNCCFKDRCEIPIKELDNLPLFFNSEDGTFIYPQDDAIVIERDKSISLGCPGTKLNIGVVWTHMTCITETTFNVFNDNADITDLYCEEPIKSTARYTGKSCESNGKEIEVGFDLGEGKFLRQMKICFDGYEQRTLYTQHNLTNLIDNREESVRRPDFEEGKFFNLDGKDLNKLYTRKIQRPTINKQLNIKLDSTEVIRDGNSPYFLSRGHLAPKGDFLYGFQQNASFYFVNAAPQWEIINSGSWNTLEWKIRSFAARRESDLQIFTGTFGGLVLRNYSSTPLYIYYNPPNRGVPIPDVYWKVVYDPPSQKGVAFVGTNDPFLKFNNYNFICNNILTSIKWIKLNNKNTTNGIIYACSVNELRNVVSYVPEMKINGLLIE